MKEEITRLFVADICGDFKDVILVGLEEQKEKFPYSIACINFLYELKEQGINANLRYFSEIIRSELYEEFKRYLAR